ncbi:MAG: hypothetical protein FD153_1878 [Rhodospirillaceae bacterium]|nr:MAG: hypothetical protein FD153_1878 [Rhodospirillaceae bacterium]
MTNIDVSRPETDPPRWNLADLYPGRDSATLHQDLAEIETGVRAFALCYRDRVALLAGDEFAQAIAEYPARPRNECHQFGQQSLFPGHAGTCHARIK